ncbi:MAG: peptidoglycan-binding protein [Oscillospiraceae bacterium]|nr:peptidoglycan-binding protein [Oscillospiraceae bacterium]
MTVLRPGSRGSLVELLQLALQRAGYLTDSPDGIYGPRTENAVRHFQTANSLTPDGVAGIRTHAALYPWYVGYAAHTVRTGDNLYRLSLRYGSTVRAIELANPNLDALTLQPGTVIIVPLSFPVVPTNISCSSELIKFCCRGLAARYPFLALSEIGKSVMGKPLYLFTVGSGRSKVFYNASHHANEWITTILLLHYLENLSRAAAYGESIYQISARALLEKATLAIAPAVNPDGIDLVTGALTSGSFYERARNISLDYPDIPFPSGWKANIVGTDLNLQYPAGWDEAKRIKFEQGFTSPSPRDYVGSSVLSAPESRAVYDFTLSYNPALTLSYHTQGEVIFWKFLDYEPPRSREIANLFGEVSGYLVEDTPYVSGFAGYKDWFIQNYNRPGYTIEVGLGENPLPVSQFDRIYDSNIGILTLGMTAIP